MTDIGPTGYMSDGEIIAWLEGKSNDQYGQLRNEMNGSSERGQIIKGLSELGAQAQQNHSAHVNFDNIQTFLDENKNSPERAEYEKKLIEYQIELLPCTDDPAGDAAKIKQNIDNSSLSDAEKQELYNGLTAAENPSDDAKTLAAAADTYTALGEDMKTMADDFGRVDQLGLIKIQQLVADAKQTDQLASNVLASREQAANAIVGNIRG